MQRVTVESPERSTSASAQRRRLTSRLHCTTAQVPRYGASRRSERLASAFAAPAAALDHLAHRNALRVRVVPRQLALLFHAPAVRQEVSIDAGLARAGR